jgi:integrase
MSEPVSVSTRRQRLAALRSFLRWADLMDRWTGRLDQSLYVLRLPAKAIGNPRGALTSEAAARLMRVARAKGDEALIAVMLGGGLRISEVAGLDVRDFRQEDQLAYLWIRDGKGGRSRAVPVLPDLAALVEGQVSGRRPDMPMFMTRRGRRGRLEVPGIRERVQRLAKVAGLPYLCPHMLRHTAGMRCLAIQGNVQAVSAILGHRDIRTTQGYLDHLHLADLAANLAPLPSDDEGNSAYPVTVTPLGDGFEVAPREEIDQGGMDQ